MTQRENQILNLIAANPMISQQELADTLNITRSSVAVHISNLLKKGFIAGKGYVLRTGAYAVVVGGVNVDIGGRSNAPLGAADSNPGKVRSSLGGVGRNIAHNMSLLGLDVKILTAMGEDVYGDRIAKSCIELDIDASRALRVSDCATSTYLYIADEEGEMALAVSDMEICDRITPSYLSANQQVLQNARVIVADTNIPTESLVYLAENCTAPIFCDPVSTIKAEKLRPILSKIHTLKPNRLEAELLSGVCIASKADAEKAAQALLEKGVKRVFLSMGGDGMYAATADEQLWMSNIPGDMVNTTGCGDSATAALVWAWMNDLSLEETVRAGLAAGSITMESAETINLAMSATALKLRMSK